MHNLNNSIIYLLAYFWDGLHVVVRWHAQCVHAFIEDGNSRRTPDFSLVSILMLFVVVLRTSLAVGFWLADWIKVFTLCHCSGSTETSDTLQHFGTDCLARETVIYCGISLRWVETVHVTQR